MHRGTIGLTSTASMSEYVIFLRGQWPCRGFSLVDEEGYRYTFTRGVLRPGYTLLLLTGTGGDVPTGDQFFFHWNSAYPIWNNKGDKATLRDPEGAVVDSVMYRE